MVKKAVTMLSLCKFVLTNLNKDFLSKPFFLYVPALFKIILVLNSQICAVGETQCS